MVYAATSCVVGKAVGYTVGGGVGFNSSRVPSTLSAFHLEITGSALERVSILIVKRLFLLVDACIATVHQSYTSFSSASSISKSAWMTKLDRNFINSNGVIWPIATYSPNVKGRKIIIGSTSTLFGARV